MAEVNYTDNASARRPIRARGSRSVIALASALNKAGVSPNAVSVASIGFAILGATAMLFQHESSPVVASSLLLQATACIGLRCFANLIDGMIAVEGGRATPSGPLYNDFPDRISDIAFFIAAGYATNGTAGSVLLGWSAALFSILTAYVRVLGASTGAPHEFVGPMAKPHRMAVLAIGCVALAIERQVGTTQYALPTALAVICAGSCLTIIRRLTRTARSLEVLS